MIAPETIQQVRERTNIVGVIGEAVKLTKKGRSHVGLCPFHQEKTPSFNVNDERGFYHCFGCGASGDAIKFVQETQSMSFIDAVRSLAERAGVDIVETGTELERRQAAEARRRMDDLYEVGNVAAAYFERMLREHGLAALASEELGRRELVADSPTGEVADALQSFRIGYAPYGWDGLAVHLRERNVAAAAAEKVGLLAPRKSGSGYYDRFRHRLMFAVLDIRGRVIAFSGRALPEPSAETLSKAKVESMGSSNDEPPKYVNSPESPIYKKGEAVFGLYQARQAIVSEGECVVVEGNFDVLSLHARGIKNVVAPLGTAFTIEQSKHIKRYAQSVTLLFDGDAAGGRAVRKAREPCREAELHAKVAILPAGSDPDDIARRSGPEGVRKILNGAQSMLEYLIDTELDSGFSSGDAHARAQKIKAVAELVRSENDPNVRAMAQAHADKIAERLGIADAVSFRALAASVHRAVAESEGRVQTPARAPVLGPDRARSRTEHDAVAKEILGLFFDFPSLMDTKEGQAGAALVEGEMATAVAELRRAHAQDGDELDPEQLLPRLPDTLLGFAAARLAAPHLDEFESALTELGENVDKLVRQETRRSRAEAVEEIHKAASSGDEDAEIALLRERADRARQRHGL